MLTVSFVGPDPTRTSTMDTWIVPGPQLGGWSVPVKSAIFCVVALEAGLAKILAWERAANMPSAGISL